MFKMYNIVDNNDNYTKYPTNILEFCIHINVYLLIWLINGRRYMEAI